MKKLFLFIFVSLIGNSIFAKEIEVDTFLVKKEAEINAQLNKLRAATSDQSRILENESLKNLVESVLAYPKTFDYPFASFQTMSTIASPDGAFRLFNWNIEDDNGLNSHFCYMIIPSRNREKPNNVISFKEDRVTIPPRPETTLTPNRWYGALYYNIIPIKKGSKTLYTILGYNGGSRSTNKKIIDVFYFKGKKLRMGYPIFQDGASSKRLARRVFFEYSEKVTVGVNMNDQLQAIVFDHLVPETEELTGLYDYYVPDMTYDAYRWEDNVWKYKEDLVAVNQENRKTKRYRPDTEDKDESYIEERDEWIDPVDGNPLGGGSNAIAPLEEISVDSKKRKNSNRPKKHKKRLFKRKSERPISAITG